MLLGRRIERHRAAVPFIKSISPPIHPASKQLLTKAEARPRPARSTAATFIIEVGVVSVCRGCCDWNVISGSVAWRSQWVDMLDAFGCGCFGPARVAAGCDAVGAHGAATIHQSINRSIQPAGGIAAASACPHDACGSIRRAAASCPALPSPAPWPPSSVPVPLCRPACRRGF